MAKIKRSKAMRAADLALTEQLHLKGMHAAQIATEISALRPYQLSRSQIGYDLNTLELTWRASAQAEIGIAKAKTLARIDNLEKTYWEAWRGSLGERTKTRTSKGLIGITASVETEQMTGNPAYLVGVQSCIEQRCKLLGLYGATKIEIGWRAAVAEDGHDASVIFEQLIATYIAAVERGKDGADSGENDSGMGQN